MVDNFQETPEVEVEEGVEPQGGEGQGEGAAATGKMVPIERFNQLYGRVKEFERLNGSYSEFGKPEDIKTRLEKLAQWEKAVEEQRRQGTMTPDEQDAAKRQLQIQKELHKALPGLKNLEKIEALEKKLSEFEGKTVEAQEKAVIDGHSARLTGILKANKINPELQVKIENYIVSLMDPSQRKQFVKGDFSVAETIFNNELKDGLISHLKAKNPLPEPPVRHTPGGTPPSGASKKATTMKEAADVAWSRFGKGEE